MRRAWVSVLTGALLLSLSATVFARPQTNVTALEDLGQRAHERYIKLRGEAFDRRVQEMESPRITEESGKTYELIGVRPDGFLRFYGTDNLAAAKTISSFNVWPGGDRGYDLTGVTTSATRFAIWDGGIVKASHHEFGDRVTIKDVGSSIGEHGTHVAGTMIAAGLDSMAKGSSFEAKLSSYDWSDDVAEMTDAASLGLRISNHSYGWITGWNFNTSSGGTGHTGWHWYGDAAISPTEDFEFGYYSSESRDYDEITYNAPYYLIFKSAGNDQNDGPPDGTTHYFQDPSQGYAWVESNAVRDRDGGADHYDCIGNPSTAKNIITIAAVSDAPSGYVNYVNIAPTDFTSLGPVDDGRVKPDVAANGYELYSTGIEYRGDPSDTSYTVMSGTSMASPNAAGGANLVRGFYQATHKEEMLASTLKGLLIHTADEAGNPRKFLGPDYTTGWGMINIAKAADLVVADTLDTMTISEQTVMDGEGQAFSFTWDDSSEIRVTICWTDPPGHIITTDKLNNREPQLVNDLDMWIDGPDSTYYPWRLNPDAPADAALRDGPNRVDNVEQINIEEPTPGTYTVYVVPFSSLSGGEQVYSMFVSGGNGDIQTTSAPSNEVTPIPDRFEIEGAYPNPFNPSTTVQVRMPEAGELTVRVYNTLGQQVSTLTQSYRQAGTHRVAFNGRNLASGVYYVRATMPGQAASTQKVLLLR